MTETKRYAYRIKGSDRRQEYIEAFDNSLEFVTQIISGPNVEFFSPTIGFGLLAEEKDMLFSNKRARRIRSIAELSLGPTRALRECYYALRGMPNLLPAFEGANNLYEAVLSAMIHMEIACDIDRASFTAGNRPQGSIYYGHHQAMYGNYTYADKERLVGFTENLARSVLRPRDIHYAQSIIHVEKNTAAGRLHTIGFSKLTNSVITTCGGNFTRAIYALINRFKDDKHVVAFCDADAYGNDMLRTLEYGSQKSRHITLDQAFPQGRYPKVHAAGFFPSVGEQLGLPNDLEAKRPMSNPHVKKRIEFLQRYDLADDRDIATWERNKTYEMEALSEKYTDQNNEPIGLAVYLTEFYRYNEIPFKPQPTDDDDKLMKRFKEQALSKLKDKIENSINENNPRDKIWDATWEALKPLMEKLRDKIYEEYEAKLEEAISGSLAKIIRTKLLLQYEDNPRREIYSLESVIDELFDTFVLEADWKADELMEKVEKALEEFTEETELEAEEEEIEFAAVDEEERELRDFYDVVEEEIGASPEDCAEMRKALEWRLG